MNCKNCKMQITTSSTGPRPFISINSNGTYGSYVCTNGTQLYVEGHEPEGTPNVTG
jgi:hypothetical protein